MHRGLRVLIAVAILFPAITAIVQAEPAPSLFITEVQTGSASSGSQEFIELYNNTDNDIDLADTLNSGQTVWKIEYFSSTKVVQSDFSWDATAPSGTIDLTGTILAHDYYLLSTSVNSQTYAPGGVQPDQTYSSPRLASTAGGVQLVDESGTITTSHDHVGWSDSQPTVNNLEMNPPAGGSLQRQVDDQGNYIDTQGNLSQFVSSNTASPKEAWQTPAPSDPGTTGSGGNDNEPPAASPDTLEITELLPNPASPATDANDEFVEIYNYGDEPIDLRGFTIQTGLTYAYNYVIPDGTLAPHSYASYISGDTPLALANSGGQARLLNPAGPVIDEVPAYSEAPEGQAWALFGDTWQWTITPTPAGANVLNAPVEAVKATIKKKAAVAKTTKKVATKTAAKKTNKSGAVAGAKTADGSPTDPNQVPALHPGVLAGVGGAALLYGAYEYRTDVANRLYQLRRYRATRRATRAAAKGA